MNTSALNFTIINSQNTKFSDAQIFLQEFTGKKFSKNEAEIVWKKILDHKWNMSERLRRDVGLRVATIDYVEHFYHPVNQRKRKLAFSTGFRQMLNAIGKGIRTYFEAKSKYSV